jgi:hypothetical protein
MVVDPGGEIVVQNSGGYSPEFTITQSVTIDGGGNDASVNSTFGSDLCTINAGAGDMFSRESGSTDTALATQL